MKKTIFTLLAALCFIAAPAANAQTINQEKPSEISLSYGISALGTFVNQAVNSLGILADLTDGEYVSIRSGGSKGIINLGYVYHTSKVCAVGGSFGFNRMSANLEDETGKITAASLNIFTIMADVKLNWFRNRSFGMYSKIGLGAMCLNGNLVETLHGNAWLPTGHVSAIGMEAGRSLSGFIEIGAGMKGVAQAGIRYHF